MSEFNADKLLDVFEAAMNDGWRHVDKQDPDRWDYEDDIKRDALVAVAVYAANDRDSRRDATVKAVSAMRKAAALRPEDV